ncbi:MAG: ankyrin repeat domain-containing protein [Akkermansia sp.]|nr:ankyrin repeat domain-containing protein [Akkermansia sp.]
MKTSFFMLVSALVGVAYAGTETIQEMVQRYEGTPHYTKLNQYYEDIQRTGNTHAQDAAGRTMLMYCLQELPEMHMAQIIHPLLLAGMNPNAADKTTGRTPLHHAALSNDYRLACRLLAFGADIRKQDKQGYTPAQLAKLPQLQHLLSTGTPPELRSQRVKDLHSKACRNNGAAQYELSRLYRDEATAERISMSAWVNNPQEPDSDAAESRCWLEQAAANHYPPAMHDLALRLMWGIDGKENEAEACRLLEEAAKAGHKESIDFLENTPIPGEP